MFAFRIRTRVETNWNHQQLLKLYHLILDQFYSIKHTHALINKSIRIIVEQIAQIAQITQKMLQIREIRQIRQITQIVEIVEIVQIE